MWDGGAAGECRTRRRMAGEGLEICSPPRNGYLRDLGVWFGRLRQALQFSTPGRNQVEPARPRDHLRGPLHWAASSTPPRGRCPREGEMKKMIKAMALVLMIAMATTACTDGSSKMASENDASTANAMPPSQCKRQSANLIVQNAFYSNKDHAITIEAHAPFVTERHGPKELKEEAAILYDDRSGRTSLSSMVAKILAAPDKKTGKPTRIIEHKGTRIFEVKPNALPGTYKNRTLSGSNCWLLYDYTVIKTNDPGNGCYQYVCR